MCKGFDEMFVVVYPAVAQFLLDYLGDSEFRKFFH